MQLATFSRFTRSPTPTPAHLARPCASLITRSTTISRNGRAIPTVRNFALKADNSSVAEDAPDAVNQWRDLFAIKPKERKVKHAGARGSLPDMDHSIAPDHSWKAREPMFGVRTSERPQDNAYGDEVGDWDLDADGEPRWKSAEHRRRHFI